jgi:hypothetical protein
VSLLKLRSDICLKRSTVNPLSFRAFYGYNPLMNTSSNAAGRKPRKVWTESEEAQVVAKMIEFWHNPHTMPHTNWRAYGGKPGFTVLFDAAQNCVLPPHRHRSTAGLRVKQPFLDAFRDGCENAPLATVQAPTQEPVAEVSAQPKPQGVEAPQAKLSSVAMTLGDNIISLTNVLKAGPEEEIAPVLSLLREDPAIQWLAGERVTVPVVEEPKTVPQLLGMIHERFNAMQSEILELTVERAGVKLPEKRHMNPPLNVLVLGKVNRKWHRFMQDNGCRHNITICDIAEKSRMPEASSNKWDVLVLLNRVDHGHTNHLEHMHGGKLPLMRYRTGNQTMRVMSPKLMERWLALYDSSGGGSVEMVPSF